MPLHVFEPRYRKMVVDALASHRTIGMVLLKPGYEENYQGRPPIYETGCTGTIVEEERLEDGRYNLLLLGQARFRVVEERGGEPYRLAVVELAVVEERPDSKGDASSLDLLRERLLAAIVRLTDGATLAGLRDDVSHLALVNGLSQGLDLSPLEKLSLLECDTLEARALRLLEILEFHALERTAGRSGTLH
jgi:Lon protease-like protein